ncbi:MAG TPA: hypothetical protein VHV08_12605, partial [Pirellulales bacterium]|nr:hypothetical protein [Pirellulales bacterium]
MHDLFPTRYLTIALVAIAGLASVAVIALMHHWSGSLAAMLSAEEVAALDLRAPHNISHWFSAILLAAASLVAMFIYSLRKHRLDDYHGRYRVW